MNPYWPGTNVARSQNNAFCWRSNEPSVFASNPAFQPKTRGRPKFSGAQKAEAVLADRHQGAYLKPGSGS